MMKNFELLYSIPQEINDNEEWPKYTLRSLYLENDTLHTLLLKTNYISSISLSDSLAKIKHLFTPLPKNEFPVFLKKYQQEWYTASTNSIQKFQNSSQYQTLITIPQETLLEFFDIIENKIIYATRQPKIVLTDLDGKELFQVSINYFFISTTVYNNILTNGFYDILIKKKSSYFPPCQTPLYLLRVSERHLYDWGLGKIRLFCRPYSKRSFGDKRYEWKFRRRMPLL